jgi:hypothetical protein
MFIDREPEMNEYRSRPMCQLSQTKFTKRVCGDGVKKPTREHCTPKGVPEFFLILRSINMSPE